MDERRRHKCIDCIHCDVKNLMCYPESEDCCAEYKLDMEDLETEAVCDFFEARN